MKRSGPIQRTTRLRSTGRPKAKPRSPEDALRIYGDEAKRKWMKRQPCCICGRTPSDAAHLTNGGMSRKDNAERTVPLCADVVPAGYSGHHSEYDGGKRSFRAKYAIDLSAEAERVERAWQARRSA